MKLSSKWDNLFDAFQKDSSSPKSRIWKKLFSKGKTLFLLAMTIILFYNTIQKPEAYDAQSGNKEETVYEKRNEEL